MSESFDREKVIDCMFDPITSEILAELEDGEKECSILAQLTKTVENDQYSISANTEKLGSLLEDSDAFDGAINGLEKMDSYLN